MAEEATDLPQTITKTEKDNSSKQDMEVEAVTPASEQADGDVTQTEIDNSSKQDMEVEAVTPASDQADGDVTQTEKDSSSKQDMEVEAVNPASDQADGDATGNGLKHEREDGNELEKEDNGGSKKQKVDDKIVEEQNLEKLDSSEAVDGENVSTIEGPVSVGSKFFGTSVEMFDYFFRFLHNWSPNLNVNKYEHMMLLDLLKKGHLEPDKKIGSGIRAFQVRFHPQYKSRCFFLIRDDESVDDFSFRKCVDHISPLPENMQIKHDVNKALGRRNGGGHGGKFSGGGGGRGGRAGRGRGRGRGGKPRY